MAALTAKRRNALPKAKFALPGSRRFPIDTKARAANAKARATQMAKRGKISASTKARIHAAANKKLYGKAGGKKAKK